MPSILFVCTGNICRSPMAAAILRGMLAGRADAGPWQVASAGTWGMDGYQADLHARAALRSLGFSAEGHVARTVTADMLAASDLILTMERGQQEALRLEFPQAARRIFLLAEMVNARYDIEDPIGRGQPEFDATARELQQILAQAFDRIVQVAVENAENRRDAKGRTE